MILLLKNKKSGIKFINIREACPCGMKVMSNIYKEMDMGDEPFNSMIGWLIKTKRLKVKTCKEMHGDVAER